MQWNRLSASVGEQCTMLCMLTLYRFYLGRCQKSLRLVPVMCKQSRPGLDKLGKIWIVSESFRTVFVAKSALHAVSKVCFQLIRFRNRWIWGKHLNQCIAGGVRSAQEEGTTFTLNYLAASRFKTFCASLALGLRMLPLRDKEARCPLQNQHSVLQRWMWAHPGFFLTCVHICMCRTL